MSIDVWKDREDTDRWHKEPVGSTQDCRAVISHCKRWNLGPRGFVGSVTGFGGATTTSFYEGTSKTLHEKVVQATLALMHEKQAEIDAQFLAICQKSLG